MGKKWATWDSLGADANAIIDAKIADVSRRASWDYVRDIANARIEMAIEMLSVRASWDSLGGWGEHPMDDQEIMEEAVRRIRERNGR